MLQHAREPAGYGGPPAAPRCDERSAATSPRSRESRCSAQSQEHEQKHLQHASDTQQRACKRETAQLLVHTFAAARLTPSALPRHLGAVVSSLIARHDLLCCCGASQSQRCGVSCSGAVGCRAEAREKQLASRQAL